MPPPDVPIDPNSVRTGDHQNIAAGIESVQVDRLTRSFKKHVRGSFSFDWSAKALYATDASQYQIAPLGVVVPVDRQDLETAFAIAMNERVPVIPRGGGTSLSGQTIGRGLVVDCSQHLNRILNIDLERKTVRVQPGVVLAQLNRELAPLGLQFGPDVSTVDRANLGGMIANNSAGSRSVKFGKTVDHVLSLDVLLSDGSTSTFGSLSTAATQKKLALPGREGGIYRTVDGVVRELADEIDRKFPNIVRRVSGYNLDLLNRREGLDLSKLIVGSEGTLAFVAEAELKVVPLARYRGLVVLHFDDLQAGMELVPTILATDPSAVELIDQFLLRLARASQLYRSRIDFVEGDPAAILIVEYQADDPASISAAFDRLKRLLAGTAVTAWVFADEPARMEHIWNVRKMALPLLFALPGKRKPVSFVEDTAVAPEKLAAFVGRFKQLLREHETDGSFYGHASVGCLHIRPLLDLASEIDRRAMERMADQVADLVAEFGGSMSGEHGDGLARSRYNRRLFGEAIYAGFGRIKQAFDPDGLMNPGKIVAEPAIIADLRPLVPSSLSIETAYSFEDEGGMLAIVEGCNGNGLCRRTATGTMCPSYMATLEEKHSPRGRANLLRAAIDDLARSGDDAKWKSPELAESLDLCLSCKACKTECASSVDIAKLKAEYLNDRHRRRPAKLLEKMMADYRGMGRLASALAPFSNWVARAWPVPWLAERLVGLSGRRRLPAFVRRTFTRWFNARSPNAKQGRGSRGRVVLWVDCFTEFHEPKLGRMAVELLEEAGFEVSVADRCCGRTAISKGFLDKTKAEVQGHLTELESAIDAGVPFVGIEPSCLLTLADEWVDLVPGELSRKLAGQTYLVDDFLALHGMPSATPVPSPNGATETTGSPSPPVRDVVFHGHCHQKAATATGGSLKALQSLGGVTAKPLDAGCCGMAGSFGYEASHVAVSERVFGLRLKPLLDANAGADIVAPGFSCRSQIRDLAGRTAVHPIEWLHRRRVELRQQKPQN